MNNYFVYITTNPRKTTLYVGVTNDLQRRVYEHFENRGRPERGFAAKYNCYNLIYFEKHEDINQAIYREKEIKKWRREKKENLIRSFNSNWNFLNKEIFDN